MATNSKLIPLKRIRDERPDWPYSPWATGDLIRRGRLGCVRVGKRVFVTDELLAAFIEQHAVQEAREPRRLTDDQKAERRRKREMRQASEARS